MNLFCGQKQPAALRVNEIFYSIQGESLYMGRPCVFVRLTGCNLRCTYCDTGYAYTRGRFMGIEQILSRAGAYGVDLVEITGGEPLMQPHTPDLAEALLAKGFEVMIETNGTYPIDLVPDACMRIMDIKCPASGESLKTDFDNLNRLGGNDQVKFVICNRKDYDYARHILKHYWSGRPPVPVLISPAAGRLAPASAAAWILEDRLDVRLHLQLHKILWPNEKRGV
ncbi:MAG: radical SAM protein [Desulfobacterales bacterium]|nr:radical SAM protein [Desulfobacterales bacterium]